MFVDVSKNELRIIADSSCKFKELKMNNYIYREGSVPEACYIVINGNVKIESPGFEAKKMLEMIIVGQSTIFGQKDLN